MSGINDHYITQHYLRAFQDKKGTIYAYDKVDKRPFPTGTRAIATINNFDRIDSALWDRFDFDPNETALHIQAVESQWHRILDTLVNFVSGIKDERCHVAPRKGDIGFLLAFQYLRTPSMRRECLRIVQEQERKGKQVLKRELLETDPLDERFAIFCHFLLMFVPFGEGENVLEVLAQHFSNDYFCNVKTRSVPPWLYTSDRPVVRQEDGSNVRFYFPLTPQAIIELSSAPAACPSDYPDCAVISATLEEVIQFNEAQVRNAERQVYSCDGCLDIAEQI